MAQYGNSLLAGVTKWALGAVVVGQSDGSDEAVVVVDDGAGIAGDRSGWAA